MSSKKIRIVCVSDTHNHNPGEGYKLPQGDVLIHAGDLTNQGSFKELQKAVDWISKADFEAKIVVAGNHDLSLDPEYALKHSSGWGVVPVDVEACRRLVVSNPDFVYLQHAHAVVHLPQKGVSLRVFGSPYSPDRGKQNWAFQYNNNASVWDDVVPEQTDILITHTPPAGYLDASQHWQAGGCSALATTLSSVKPLLHVFGHCHEGRGACVLRWAAESDSASVAMMTWDDPGLQSKKQSLFDLTGKAKTEALRPGRDTALVNASILAMSFSYNRGAKSFNKPIVVDVDIPLRDAVAT